jgi:ADP-ribose pyrophosphatase
VDKPVLPHQIRKVYQGRIFAVAVESVTLPRGQTLDVEVVRHPGSVVVLPITDAGEVILVKQYRHPIGRWLWELPAGSLKHGEDPETAAGRECHEEIGLIASKMEKLGAFFPTPGYCDEEFVLFKATGLREPGPDDAAAQPDEDEDIQAKPFAVEELRRLVRSGEIVDLKTVAGLLFL